MKHFITKRLPVLALYPFAYIYLGLKTIYSRRERLVIWLMYPFALMYLGLVSVKHHKKQLASLALAMSLVLFLTPIGTMSVFADNVEGVGYSFNPDTGALTVTSNDGTTAWRSNSSIEKSAVTSVTVESDVTTIGNNAFFGCTNLSSITLPSSLITIGNRAFYNCTSLSSIDIPSDVITIDYSAFEYCTSLSSITLPPGVTTIVNSAFYHCTSLSSITLPSGVTTIGNYAFEYCTSLSSITLPSGVTTIGISAFEYCTSLSSITLPSSVTTIDDRAFEYCTSLTSVTMPNSRTITAAPNNSSYGSAYLEPTSTTELMLKATAKSGYRLIDWSKNSSAGDTISGTTYTIGSTDAALTANFGVPPITGPGYSFNPNTGALTITSNGGTIAWRDNTSIEKTAVTSVTVGNDVTSISSLAFNNCASLSSITLPSSVTSIGSSSFYYCTSLTSVTMPSGETITAAPNNTSYGSAYLEPTSPTQLTLTATAKSGYRLVDWTQSTGANGTISGTTYTIGSTDAALTANFAPPPSIAVTTTYLDSLKVGQTVSSGAAVVYTLSDGTYVASPNMSHFTVTGLPAGLTAGTPVRTSDTVITIPIIGTPTAANTNATTLTIASNIPAANIDAWSSSITPTGTITASAVAMGDGTAVSGAPTVSGNPTASSITVNTITNAGSSGQAVEYAISTTTTAPTSGWQSSATFSSLTSNTDYYVFARTKANTNYNAGTAQASSAIKTADISDAEKVAGDKAALVFDTIKNSNTAADNITGDLTLPSTGSVNSSGITWSVSSSGYIVTSSGAVTRPAYSEGDKTVTLTATIIKGTESDTKTFSLTIKAAAATDAEKVAEDKAALVFNTIKNSNTAADNITGDLTLPSTGSVNSSGITWSVSSSGYIVTSSGAVTRPGLTDSDKTVVLTATISSGSATDTKAFTLTIKAIVPTYTIAINSGTGGSVQGGGTFDQGTSCTVTASPDSGYSFTNWTENGTAVNTNSIYTFTVTGNRSLTANFTPISDNNNGNNDNSVESSNKNSGGSSTSTKPGITVDVKQADNAPPTAISDSATELADKVLTEDELNAVKNGERAALYITIEDISETVPTADKTAVLEAIKSYNTANDDDNLTLAMYVDISLFKKVGSITTQLRKIDGKVKIQIEIPQELRADNRSYAIARLHDGVVKIITGSYDSENGLFNFETDRFSTYALLYEDDDVDSEDVGDPEVEDAILLEDSEDDNVILDDSFEDEDVDAKPEDISDEISDDEASDEDNPDTGVHAAVLPALASATALVLSRKKKK